MTEIERKALALLNEVQIEMHGNPGWYEGCNRTNATPVEALCRAIEQHEAFRQEVSDAVEAVFAGYHDAPIPWVVMRRKLERFIIAKPDPLVEALRQAFPVSLEDVDEGNARDLRAAMKDFGYEWRKIGEGA